MLQSSLKWRIEQSPWNRMVGQTPVSEGLDKALESKGWNKAGIEILILMCIKIFFKKWKLANMDPGWNFLNASKLMRILFFTIFTTEEKGK